MKRIILGIVVLMLGAASTGRADVILTAQADGYMLHSYYAGWTTPDGGTTWNASYTSGEILDGNYADSTRTTMPALTDVGPGANGDAYWPQYPNHPVSTWYEAHMNDLYARRPFVQFDLTGVTAVGTATLDLHSAYNSIAWIKAYRSLRTVVELECTWNEYSSGNAWTTPGGDFDNTLWAHFGMPATPSWVSVDVTSLVQAMLGAGQSTATFIMLSDNATTGQFHTREYTPYGGSLGDYASTLTITDPIPEPGTTLLIGTGIAGVLGYLRRRRMR